MIASTTVRQLLLKGKAAILDPKMGWKTTHFWGPMANWGIVAAGVLDMTTQGPEMISIPMTGTLCVYSLLFMRFAWMVQPRNYLLLSCHIFNEGVQLIQLGRALKYQREQKALADQRTQQIAAMRTTTTPSTTASPTTTTPMTSTSKSMFAATAAGVAAAKATSFHPVLMLRNKVCALPMPELIRKLLMHPAGPFTIFFWAPAIKWGISAANLVDYKRPVDKVSIPQQLALFATGVIWARWSFVITPVNYNLATVNVCLAATSFYHLMRKLVYDPFPVDEDDRKAVAKSNNSPAVAVASPSS
ncbi:Mitochondrial pyruvate carrier 2 [Perkinsus olseni]|uniref:Mitochondrial pyruvate carrier n=1 Tax=Perkinsus olseni TaxID=32597 RepID=A0A7J6KWA7_PEROL|nr:Mitochondrial pyruvate carrier 2 [Perkinsus olseni]